MLLRGKPPVVLQSKLEGKLVKVVERCRPRSCSYCCLLVDMGAGDDGGFGYFRFETASGRAMNSRLGSECGPARDITYWAW